MAQANSRFTTVSPISARRKGAKPPAGPKPDPIFAAINAHKVASAEYTKVNDELEKLEERLPKDLVDNKPWIFKNAWDFRYPADVDKHVKRHLGDAARSLGPESAKRVARLEKAAIRELRGMLDTHFEKQNRARKATGLMHQRNRMFTTADAERQALELLCKTKPRTAAGHSALIDYVGSLVNEHGTDSMMVYWPSLLKTLAASLPTLSWRAHSGAHG